MDGGSQIHGWLALFLQNQAVQRAGQPTGQITKKNVRPDPFSRRARRPFFGEKCGWPAGQPTMYLASPIQFGGIVLVLV